MKKFNSFNSNLVIRGIGISVVAVAVLLAGCAGTPAPLEQMAVSRAAVVNAKSSGSDEFAPLQLKSAMEKMEAADHAMKDKDYKLARQLAEQAQVDAQLAAEMARSVKAKKAADALQEDSRILRQEIERKNN